jgi:hypothetical protein
VFSSIVALIWIYYFSIQLRNTIPVYILLSAACLVYYILRDKFVVYVGNSDFRILDHLQFWLYIGFISTFVIFMLSYFLGLLYPEYYAPLLILNRLFFLAFLGFFLVIIPFVSVFTYRGFVSLSLDYVRRRKEENGALEIKWLKKGLKRLVDMLSPVMKIPYHQFLFKIRMAYFDGERIEDDLKNITAWVSEYYPGKPVDHVKFRRFYSSMEKYIQVKEPTRGYELQERQIPFLNLIVVIILGIVSIIIGLPNPV